MRKSICVVVAAALLGGCDGSNDGSTANQAAAKPDRPKKKSAYCFFKDKETKDWAASRDKDGNVVVQGKAYRSDPRYQAILAPAKANGPTAEISPTIQQNATGYAAPENWWEVKSTIPDSAAVETVTVRCGQKAVAELKLTPKG